MNLLPKRGIDQLLLGAKSDDVNRLLGEPYAADTMEWPDGSNSEVWIYLQPALNIHFEPQFDWRASSITCADEQLQFEGTDVIGLSVSELKRLLPNLIEGEVAENGMEFFCPESQLSFWVENQKVQSVTVFPDFPEDQEQPVWPS